MAPHIFSREQKFALGNNHTSSLIVGAIVVVLLCLLCFFRFRRSRANKKRNPAVTAETNPSSARIPLFSRNRITASIIMPEKSITRKAYSDKEGVSSDHTRLSVPSTLSPHRSPRNTSPAASRPRTMSILNPAHPRHSRSSSGFSGYTQSRFLPGSSSRLSFASFLSASQAKRVHQPFEPTLADELAPRCGEHLSVLQSFDDGWCVVARDTSPPSRASLLLSTGTKNNGDNIDIGLVPAWVFVKPLEGVAFKRPFRSSSLNALHFGQDPARARDWITSWSNFA